MAMQTYESKITVRCYCETCQAEYMTEAPEKGCPVCESGKTVNKKTKKEND